MKGWNHITWQNILIFVGEVFYISLYTFTEDLNLVIYFLWVGLIVHISVQTWQNVLHLHLQKPHRLIFVLKFSMPSCTLFSTAMILNSTLQELEKLLSELSSEPRYQLRRTTSFWLSGISSPYAEVLLVLIDIGLCILLWGTY